jgi:hypothetical protein
MNDFDRGFNDEIEKIAAGIGDLMQQYGVRPEHLIGGGLGAAAGGVGGYYGGKALTDSQAGGIGGAALGALGGGALGAAGGGAIGKAIRARQPKTIQTGEPPAAPAQTRYGKATIAPEEKPLVGHGTQAEWDAQMAEKPMSYDVGGGTPAEFQQMMGARAQGMSVAPPAPPAPALGGGTPEEFQQMMSGGGTSVVPPVPLGGGTPEGFQQMMSGGGTSQLPFQAPTGPGPIPGLSIPEADVTMAQKLQEATQAAQPAATYGGMPLDLNAPLSMANFAQGSKVLGGKPSIPAGMARRKDLMQMAEATLPTESSFM